MKILVLGHGGYGKGTFCKMLEEIHGLKSMSSSQAALPYIFPALQAVNTAYSSHERAYNERHECRQLWKELISLYNYPDKTTLAREILGKVDIYDGMRCNVEYAASVHLFDLILWVDASERVDPDPTMLIQYDPSIMFHVDNNLTKELLHIQAVGVGDLLK